LTGVGKIDFFYLNTNVPGFSEERAREWMFRVIQQEGGQAGNITCVFCDDDYLLNLNRTFLSHDTLTDIISFDYSAELGGVSGDLFISVPTVFENASMLSVSAESEIHRVLVHGVLHLLGYDDKEAGARAHMRETENYYLSLLF
jgi:probable rRNA maturation factor